MFSGVPSSSGLQSGGDDMRTGRNAYLIEDAVGSMIRNVGAAQFHKSPGRCPVFYYFRNSIFSKLNRVSKIVKAVSQDGFLRFCDPGGIRTPNQQNRNLSFYPIELRSRKRAQI